MTIAVRHAPNGLVPDRELMYSKDRRPSRAESTGLGTERIDDGVSFTDLPAAGSGVAAWILRTSARIEAGGRGGNFANYA